MTESTNYARLELLESRIDWLTCTVKPGKKLGVLASRANAIMSIREKEGFTRKAFRSPFYQGESIDGCTWGTRDQDAMLRLSGEMAGRYAPTAITFADNVSRLDVQITARDEDINRNWARMIDDALASHPLVQGHQIETRLYTRRPEGITSYIGSPRSDRLLRCYDKYSESEHEYPMGSWRWEVEYKHERANNVAKRLQTMAFSPQAVLDLVGKAYGTYGHDVPIQFVPTGWRDKGVKHRTDDQRRLEWLRTSVGPMVERMRESTPTGTLLVALRFADVLDTLEGRERPVAELGELNDSHGVELVAHVTDAMGELE